MNIHRIISAGFPLYRYDITRSPKGKWDKDYKSLIYYWPDAGPKNEIGAFFFFDTEYEAVEVGREVLGKKKDMIRDNNPKLSIWITNTVTHENLYMLDLSKCKNVVDLYVTLWNEQIDIFRDDFYRFDSLNGSVPLSQIKEHVACLATHNDETKSSKLIECKCEILNLYNCIDENNQLAYACQGLTDFSNGIIFKDILEEKGFDGYIFQETDAKTFCLFNSHKLSLPKVSLIH